MKTHQAGKDEEGDDRQEKECPSHLRVARLAEGVDCPSPEGDVKELGSQHE